MVLTPKKIYEDLLKNEIDRSLAADLLISFIKNAEISETRLEGIEFLQKIEYKAQNVFSFLENLLLSDDELKYQKPPVGCVFCQFDAPCMNKNPMK